MTYAPHIAARRGWELFTETSPAPSREGINATIEEIGLPGISARMYDHYGRLLRHGVADYIPINEFDIALKTGRLGKMSA